MLLNNTWRLYELIDVAPNINQCRMKTILKWNSRKLKRHLNGLIKDGLIKTKDNKHYYLTPWQEMVNWDEMNTKPDDYKDG